MHDITDYLPSHPGGAEKVMQAAGKAIDPYWNVYQQHFRTSEAMELLEKYKIGEIHPDEDNRSPQWQWRALFIRPLLELVTTAGAAGGGGGGGGDDSSRGLLLDLGALKSMGSITSVPVTVQCGGNRRGHMNKKEKTSGISWGTGGISTGLFTNRSSKNRLTRAARAIKYGRLRDLCNQFTGVRLNEVLGQHFGLKTPQDAERMKVKHIVFHAKDGMSASVPIEHCLDPYGCPLLAWDMNGKPLSPEHGAPLRLVVPGQVGVRHVKWLTKIEASSEEALGPWQRGIAYKGFPPSLKDFKDAKPELVPSMQKVPVQSVICFPADGYEGTRRNLEPEPTAPPTTYALTKSEKGEPCINVRGWAYS
eukprot:g17256.t1